MPCRAPKRAASTATRRSTTCSGSAISCWRALRVRERGSLPGTDRPLRRQPSSGELYDMYGMTAAHKTLPLPTYARGPICTTARAVAHQPPWSVRRQPPDRFVVQRRRQARHAARGHDARWRCARSPRVSLIRSPQRLPPAELYVRPAPSPTSRTRSACSSGCTPQDWQACLSAPPHRQVAPLPRAPGWDSSPSSINSRRARRPSASPTPAWQGTQCPGARARVVLKFAVFGPSLEGTFPVLRSLFSACLLLTCAAAAAAPVPVPAPRLRARRRERCRFQRRRRSTRAPISWSTT